MIFELCYIEAITWNDMMSSLSKNQGVFKINVFSYCFPKKKELRFCLNSLIYNVDQIGLEPMTSRL